MTGCVQKRMMPASTHYKDGKFYNEKKIHKFSFMEGLEVMWFALTNKHKASVAKEGEVPVQTLSKTSLLALEDNSVVRLGHSTLLFKIEGGFWITDPVFSERASPFSWVGPKRFHKPPISLEELPALEGVIISHNHYDHLDEASIQALAAKTKQFYVPLGVLDNLESFGIQAQQVTELDWWQEKQVGKLHLIATPAQHFSGRGLFDGDETSWNSWVLKTDDVKLFFSGDTGYFAGFKEIGKKYGPFDMSFMETGAYSVKWSEVHMLPKESVQAHLDVGAKYMFPIHNGTFDLSVHSWYEPFEAVSEAARTQAVQVCIPKMGESISLVGAYKTQKWWKSDD